MFQVGDKVIFSHNYSFRCDTGIVERVSDKRGDVTVKLVSRGRLTFDKNGGQRGTNNYIELLTPEIQQWTDRRDLALKCYNTFHWMRDNDKFTIDQLERIMKILKENDNE